MKIKENIELTLTRTNVSGYHRTDDSNRGLAFAGFRTLANDGEPMSPDCGTREKVASSSPVGHPSKERLSGRAGKHKS